MAKKIIAVLAALVIAYLLVVWVPKHIDKTTEKEKARMDKMEQRAREKADETAGDKLGITGGDAGFGGKFTEKARDAQTEAHRRSVEALEKIDE